jgi:hypothetical protein
MLRVRILVVAVVAVVGLTGTAAPAGAQGYTGWIEHPYPSAGLWYCDWSGSQYWCQNESGTWVPANPDWYKQASAEMMRVFGQPVL